MAPWANTLLVSSWILHFCSITSAGLHRLSFLQLVTPQAAPGLLKRLSALRVDDLLLSVYDSDSGRLVPRNSYSQDRQDFWNQSSTQCLSWDSWMQTTYQILVREVNTSAPQAEPYYMQVLKNCELDDATRVIRAITRYALNGEDMLQYLGNHNRWISVHPAAWPLTERLNQRGGSNPVISHISLQRCAALLKATRSFIAQKTARPTARVALIPGNQTQPRRLVCHVTGFYPPSIEVTWEQRDQGEQLSSGIQPNGDPTFQIQVSTELGQEGAGPEEHVCVVRHSSLGNTPLRVTWARPTARVALIPGNQTQPRRLVCHVTGFYPPSIEVTWEQRDQGEQLSSGIQPNGDPTFQIQVSTELGQEGAGPEEHVCVVRHSSLGNTPLRVTWDSQRPGWPGVLGIMAGCILTALAIGVLGLLLWKRPGVWMGMYRRVQIQPGTHICSSHD
nr:T-cell surface glycoprotein CD1b-2-like [Pelodiscus sinensis]|eukprot:XP_025042222.1 T-cell surface glycoprotein CD1b-2-like [Pelodiscus sinensis]